MSLFDKRLYTTVFCLILIFLFDKRCTLIFFFFSIIVIPFDDSDFEETDFLEEEDEKTYSSGDYNYDILKAESNFYRIYKDFESGEGLKSKIPVEHWPPCFRKKNFLIVNNVPKEQWPFYIKKFSKFNYRKKIIQSYWLNF